MTGSAQIVSDETDALDKQISAQTIDSNKCFLILKYEVYKFLALLNETKLAFSVALLAFDLNADAKYVLVC